MAASAAAGGAPPPAGNSSVQSVMKLTGEQLIDFISKLASPVRKVFGAGPPSLIGGEKWQLDLSGIAPADRPAAVKAAAAKCATTLPDGSALQIGSLKEEHLSTFSLCNLIVALS